MALRFKLITTKPYFTLSTMSQGFFGPEIHLTWTLLSPVGGGWKEKTTAHGAPQSRKEMEQAWLNTWKELSQDQIQQWIERIPVHIKEIIRLKGGNEYHEGRQYFKRSFIGRRIKGILSKHIYLE